MSIYARPGDFKNFGSLPLAITAVELEIPKHDFASPLSQPVSISVDEKYMIFSPGRRKVGHYAVRSWDADDHHGAVATLVNIFGGGTLYLTNYQLVTLERQGRFKPYKSSGSIVNDGQTLALNDWQRESAEKWLGYVTAIADAAQRRNRAADKALIMQVAADRADSLGDNPPPSYGRSSLSTTRTNTTRLSRSRQRCRPATGLQVSRLSPSVCWKMPSIRSARRPKATGMM